MFHIRKNEIGHTWWRQWLTVSACAGGLALAYFTGGNPHAADKHPGVNPMPYFSVAPQEAGTGEKMPTIARETGATVCQKVVVLQSRDGSFELIERPVLDEQKQIPLLEWQITAAGPVFQQRQDAVMNMTVYNLNGQPANPNTSLTNCDAEQLTTTHVTSVSDGTIKPYVLAGPNATVSDGDAIPLTLREAVDGDLVHYDMPGLTQDQVDLQLRSLGQ